MGDKRKFRIGQPVKVNLNYRIKVDYDQNGYRRVKRTLEWGTKTETDDLVLAIVTGVKTFQEGQYHKGSSTSHFGYGGSYDDYEPAYLVAKNVVDVWAVRTGYKNKEIYFFYEDIEVLVNEGCPDDVNIPYFYNGWTDYYRKKMSRDSKDFPRDKEGKWA